MAWIIHHLDVLEHYAFQYANTYVLRASSLYSRSFQRSKSTTSTNHKQESIRLTNTPSYKNLSEAWACK